MKKNMRIITKVDNYYNAYKICLIKLVNQEFKTKVKIKVKSRFIPLDRKLTLALSTRPRAVFVFRLVGC